MAERYDSNNNQDELEMLEILEDGWGSWNSGIALTFGHQSKNIEEAIRMETQQVRGQRPRILMLHHPQINPIGFKSPQLSIKQDNIKFNQVNLNLGSSVIKPIRL